MGTTSRGCGFAEWVGTSAKLLLAAIRIYGQNRCGWGAHFLLWYR